MRMVPIVSYVWILGLQCNCLGRIKMCDLVGRGMSVGEGFEVSKTRAISVSSLCLAVVSQDVRSPTVFIAPQFTISRKWKQPKCPSVDAGIIRNVVQICYEMLRSCKEK